MVLHTLTDYSTPDAKSSHTRLSSATGLGAGFWRCTAWDRQAGSYILRRNLIQKSRPGTRARCPCSRSFRIASVPSGKRAHCCTPGSRYSPEGSLLLRPPCSS